MTHSVEHLEVYWRIAELHNGTGHGAEPSFISNGLLDFALDLARVHRGHCLRLERSSVLAGIEHARVVHGLLERVGLPAESVISVSSKALGIARAQDERLRAVSGPRKVVELSCIPQSLVGKLWHTDGMR